jgi:hypothetical protein
MDVWDIGDTGSTKTARPELVEGSSCLSRPQEEARTALRQAQGERCVGGLRGFPE